MKTQFDVLLKTLQDLIARQQDAILDGVPTFEEYKCQLGVLWGMERAKREVLNMIQKHEEHEDD